MVKSPSIRLINEYLQRYSFSTLLPYEYYDEDKGIFINKNNIGFVFKAIPLVGADDKIESTLSQLFQYTLPEESVIQFLLISDNKVEHKLNYWANSVNNKTDDIYTALRQERINYFVKKSQKGELLLKDFKVVISVSVPLKDYTSQIHQISELKNSVKSILLSANISFIESDAEDLINTLGDILNLDDSLMPRLNQYNKYENISDQIIEPSTQMLIGIDDIGQDEGEYRYKLFRIRRYPQSFSLSRMSNLIGELNDEYLRISCPFLINFSVYIPSQKTATLKIKTSAEMVEKQLIGVGKFFPSLKKEYAEHEYVKNLLEGGQRVVKTNFQILLYGKRHQIKENAQSHISLYRYNGFDLVPAKYTQHISLISILPMSLDKFMLKDLMMERKFRTTISHEPKNLLPIQGEWYGTQNPKMLLLGRRGQISYFDPYDNSQDGGYNVVISGGTGSGKSVFMQELVKSSLARGAKVIVFDMGESFKRLASIVKGGNFIQFNSKSAICLNPFTNLENLNERERLEILSYISLIIRTMAAPSDGTNDLEKSNIEKSLIRAFEKYTFNTDIQKIAEELASDKDIISQNLSRMLFSYTADGFYGKFFNGKANINFDNDLNVIEFAELNEKTDLRNVIVQLIIVQIYIELLKSQRSREYVIVIDEAWKVLGESKDSKFIEAIARTVRKYRGSLVVASQSVADFFMNPATEVIFQNSAWKLYLAQNTSSIEMLKKNQKLIMSSGQSNLISSLKTVHGKYAEILIEGPNGFSITRLILDSFSKVLYSTSPKEIFKVNENVERGMSLTDSIKKVAEEVYGEN